jgi:hypothetical protein
MRERIPTNGDTMKTLKVLLAAAIVASAVAANAQTSAAPAPTAGTAPSEAVLTTKIPSGISAPTFGDFTLKAGLKSQNTSARVVDTQKRTYRAKHEMYVGLNHKSGFGLQAMAVENAVQFKDADSKKDAMGAGDPSLTIIHPALYDKDGGRVWGQLRKYFPVTSRSNNRNQQQYAYYLYASQNLPQGWSTFNQLTPRYFQQSYYKAEDSKYLAEDYTTLAKKMSDAFKYGLGQHTQVEWHHAKPMGTVAEIYPFATFTLSQNAFIEPRLYLPVYSVGTVYDGPQAVDLKNAQAEIFVQISI